MVHESMLVVSTRGESIGKIIHYDGDETFLVERGKVFPEDFGLRYENITGVSEDGALVFELTEYPEDDGDEGRGPTEDAAFERPH